MAERGCHTNPNRNPITLKVDAANYLGGGFVFSHVPPRLQPILSLGAAMTVARMKARADGDEDLVELLDVSRVVPEDGTFRTEVALPLDLVERKLCARDAAGAIH